MRLDKIVFTDSKGKKAEIDCFKVLREIKDLRVTFDGEYQGKPAIIKCFKDIMGRFRCIREKRGLEMLSKLGITAPAVIEIGRTSQGWHCLVIEKIENSCNLYTFLSNACSEKDAEAELINTGRCLAKMHSKGILQNDMHLGNFLTQNSNIYVIDPGRMSFSQKPVSIEKGFLNLGILIMRLPDQVLKFKPEIMKVYCESRNIPFSTEIADMMEAAILRTAEKDADRLAPRVVRSNKRVVLLAKNGYKGIFTQLFFSKNDAHKFMDEFICLANAGGCDAQSMKWNGCTFQVRCYVTANPLIGLLNRLMPYRMARIAFIHTARLHWIEGWKKYWRRSTPNPPSALIEECKGWLTKRAWIIEQVRFPSTPV